MTSLNKLSLSWIMTISIICATSLALAIMGTGSYQSITDQISRDIKDKQNIALKVAAHQFSQSLDNVHLNWRDQTQLTKIIIPEIPAEFTQHQIVDKIGQLTGETATLFAWDAKSQDFWRKTTTIELGNGKRAIGTPLGAGPVYDHIISGKTYHGEATILNLSYYTTYQPTYDANDQINGILYVGIQKTKIDVFLDSLLQQYFIKYILITLVCALLMLAIIRMLLRPLRHLMKLTQTILHQNEDVTIPYQHYQNEIGLLAQTVQQLQQHLHARDQLTAERQQQQTATIERQQFIDKLIQSFKSKISDMMDKSNQTSFTLAATANQLIQTAKDGASQAQNTEYSSQQTSSNIQSVAASLSELSLSSQDISTRILANSQHITQATDDAAQAGQVINHLSNAILKIGEIVNMITDIAEQTNLLSLNATIEAARAGHAGKGFAVVASEIKQLAAQTAQATVNIGHQIEAVQAASGNAVTAIDKIEQVMCDLQSYATELSATVQQQDNTTQQIHQAIQEVSHSTMRVQENMQQLSHSVGDAHLAANDVRSVSNQMKQQNETLTQEVSLFLSKVQIG